MQTTSGTKLPHLLSNQPGQLCTPVQSESKIAAVQEGIPCTAQRPWQEPPQKEPQKLNGKQMNNQQTANKELSWEVASELGNELADDTPSAENWSKKEKPKQT